MCEGRREASTAGYWVPASMAANHALTAPLKGKHGGGRGQGRAGTGGGMREPNLHVEGLPYPHPRRLMPLKAEHGGARSGEGMG